MYVKVYMCICMFVHKTFSFQLKHWIVVAPRSNLHNAYEFQWTPMSDIYEKTIVIRTHAYIPSITWCDFVCCITVTICIYMMRGDWRIYTDLFDSSAKNVHQSVMISETKMPFTHSIRFESARLFKPELYSICNSIQCMHNIWWNVTT